MQKYNNQINIYAQFIAAIVPTGSAHRLLILIPNDLIMIVP